MSWRAPCSVESFLLWWRMSVSSSSLQEGRRLVNKLLRWGESVASPYKSCFQRFFTSLTAISDENLLDLQTAERESPFTMDSIMAASSSIENWFPFPGVRGVPWLLSFLFLASPSIKIYPPTTVPQGKLERNGNMWAFLIFKCTTIGVSSENVIKRLRNHVWKHLQYILTRETRNSMIEVNLAFYSLQVWCITHSLPSYKYSI